jgi:serine kinase of HPr protein (carbohydrate metabolism regulator)
MSKIAISDLQSTDLNRLSSSESYLKDLNETEQNVQGGLMPIATIGLIMMGAGSIGIGASLGVMAARIFKEADKY